MLDGVADTLRGWQFGAHEGAVVVVSVVVFTVTISPQRLAQPERANKLRAKAESGERRAESGDIFSP